MIFKNYPEKLVAQRNGDASVMSGETSSVQATVKQRYGNAITFNYDHHLNLVMQQGTGQIQKVQLLVNLTAFL